MKTTHALILFFAMLFAGVAVAQPKPRTVRQALFYNSDNEGHAVTVEGGAVHTSSITLVVRDPNAPGTTSTVAIDRKSREVTGHEGCPEGCSLEGWRVVQIWRATEKEQ